MTHNFPIGLVKIKTNSIEMVHRVFTSGFRFFGFGPRFLGKVSLSNLYLKQESSYIHIYV